MATNGPQADLIPQATPAAPAEYRGPQEIHWDNNGSNLPAMLEAAHVRQHKHNRGDHSDCTPEDCYWTKERKRLGLSVSV
jgi:hypothetical protein